MSDLVFSDGALEAFLARFRVGKKFGFQNEVQRDGQGDVLAEIKGRDQVDAFR